MNLHEFKSSPSPFDAIKWLPDRMVLNGLMFRLEQVRSESWGGGDHFRFYKTKPPVELIKCCTDIDALRR